MKFENRSRTVASALLILFLALAGAWFLRTIGIAALQQTANFQFYADSETYYRLFSGEFGDYSLRQMVALSHNLLGPMFILTLTQQNYYAVLCLNLAIFWISVELLARIVHGSRAVLYVLLLANPITISSLLAVNKEIFSLLTLVLLLYGLIKGKWTALVFTLTCALLVRWQFGVFCLLAIAVYAGFRMPRERRFLTIAILLIAASIAIWKLDMLLGGVRDFNLARQKYDGSGLYEYFVDMQRRGFYWLVFVPKAIHLLFGLGLRMDRLFDPVSLYNDVWQLLHSTALLTVFCALIVTRRFNIRSDLVYLSILYLVVFVLTPIYVPRYFYPVYVLWIALLASTRSDRALIPHSLFAIKQMTKNLNTAALSSDLKGAQ